MSSTPSDKADKMTTLGNPMLDMANPDQGVLITTSLGIGSAKESSTVSLDSRAMNAVRNLATRYNEVHIISIGGEFMVKAGGRASFNPILSRAMEDRERIDVEAVAARMGDEMNKDSAAEMKASHVAAGQTQYINRR